MNIISRFDRTWIRCGHCGHKLGRMIYCTNNVPVVIEIKCSSCKQINTVPVKQGCNKS